MSTDQGIALALGRRTREGSDALVGATPLT
jgi:hypothetical protein